MSTKEASAALLEILEDRYLTEPERDYRVKAFLKQHAAENAILGTGFWAQLKAEFTAYWHYRSPLMYVAKH